MDAQRLIYTDEAAAELDRLVSELRPDRIFSVTDTTTESLCLPRLEGAEVFGSIHHITIPASDENKTLDSVCHVWQQLQAGGATRQSLVVCVGGGMVTDLGGFAAATFKRGLRFVNIPTTLLAMVDASVGGKTGFNFGGLKNEIGVFRNAEAVVIDTAFLTTLDHANRLSGFAEMLKHSLLDAACPLDIDSPFLDGDDSALASLARELQQSVDVKQRIVLADPTEKGLRKALNLGHTIGHAFESFALRRQPVLHGYAVAWGLVCELYLSCIRCGFPTEKMHQVAHFVFENYGRLPFTCDDYPELLALMQHDKKNVAGRINFTLLRNVGEIALDQTATTQEIEEALDFYRETM